MTIGNLENFFRERGIRKANAETYLNTYSYAPEGGFLAQQVNNRDSASWKKAEYIILKDSVISHEILSGWRKLTERDPLQKSIQKLCVLNQDGSWSMYDADGNIIPTSLEVIVQRRPDILDVIAEESLNQNESEKILPRHSQIIYYGVPGCGKSDAIMKQLKNVPDFNKVRVVFHPEYTNADFVGQILPVVNGGVRYEFCAGPFARILRKAYLNPDQNFYLVIEEMNRGQASAILGDVFQLCDRIKPGCDKDECGYGPGWSCYGIENDNVNDYIRRVPKTESDRLGDSCVPTEYAEMDNRGHVTSYKSIDIAWESFGQDGNLHFSENTAIRLPPNLSILATMNTSDQNVFTLDNAFQRRFDMKMVENKLKEDSLQYKTQIDGTEVCWGDFWKWCNAKIVVSKHFGLASTQDKCLGGWFICGEKQDAENNIPFSKELFAEKVLKYLWDDAFKRDRSVFVDACTSLEVMIQRFKDGNRFASFEAVFKLDDSDKVALRPSRSSN